MTSGAEAGGMGVYNIYPPPNISDFLQILGRKFRLKAKEPLKLTKFVNYPPQYWTRIVTGGDSPLVDIAQKWTIPQTPQSQSGQSAL